MIIYTCTHYFPNQQTKLNPILGLVPSPFTYHLLGKRDLHLWIPCFQHPRDVDNAYRAPDFLDGRTYDLYMWCRITSLLECVVNVGNSKQ